MATGLVVERRIEELLSRLDSLTGSTGSRTHAQIRIPLTHGGGWAGG